jgi:hypothetical protein
MKGRTVSKKPFEKEFTGAADNIVDFAGEVLVLVQNVAVKERELLIANNMQGQVAPVARALLVGVELRLKEALGGLGGLAAHGAVGVRVQQFIEERGVSVETFSKLQDSLSTGAVSVEGPLAIGADRRAQEMLGVTWAIVRGGIRGEVAN